MAINNPEPLPPAAPVPVLGSCDAPPATGVLVAPVEGVVVASDPPDDGVLVTEPAGAVPLSSAVAVAEPDAVGEPC
jgi:hypothetical protein